jgi:dTDP-4-amino-4,6-dideoxygalactose transaminase
MSNLALFGGRPVRATPFPPHPIIGDDEKRAVLDVLSRAELSTFIAAPGKYFLGGKNIKEFERRFAEYHGARYAVAFNSATAALHAAVVAVGVEPGQEVIVPPYTFTATATCALMANAVPVFADVDPDTYCVSPEAIEAVVSSLARAIIPVHLFGYPADMDAILALARKHRLKVIEDCAQAPGARYKGQFVGTLGDCGIFSFTENKNITTGEGGMLITSDPAIAEAARMVRNHGEAIWEGQTTRTYTATMLGWNYRMTEMEAALGIVQFGRMEDLNGARVELCQHLTRRLMDLPGLEVPRVAEGNSHVYYVYPLKYDESVTGIARDGFVKALIAEGVPFGAGYIRPLYLSPLYHDRKLAAFQLYKGSARYEKGSCPVAERLYERELILTPIARPPATRRDMDDVVEAIQKVLANVTEFSGAPARA